MGKTILLTGATGFLGSHLAEKFIQTGDKVIALKRQPSDTWRCSEFGGHITWINHDENDWKEEVLKHQPAVFIHSAWSGVSAAYRSQWKDQLKNLDFLFDLLELAKTCNAQKFIGLGSQAEYGFFDGKIDESFPAQPNSAYGLVKLMAMEAVKCFCDEHHIDWIWLRLFPFYGERESIEWFIPILVKNIYRQSQMNMTKGEQQYAYLYVKDFADWMIAITQKKISSGIYNISSKYPRPLKAVVEKVIGIMAPQEHQINFGALPYRLNQPMLLAGSIEKLEKEIGSLPESDFEENLRHTVNYIVQHIERY
jgi:nucleoside-diphosphate-sugar epimerase